jgi:hypothetical protein
MADVPKAPDQPVVPPPQPRPPDTAAAARNEKNRAAEAVKQPHPGWKVDAPISPEQLKMDLTKKLDGAGIRDAFPPARPDDAKAKPERPASLNVDQVRSAVQARLPDRNAVDDLRAYLRENPGDAMKTGDMRTASSLLEFAKLGPDKRDLQPSPSVDRAIHKAVGIPDGKYVSQGSLDELARATRDDPDSLHARGLSKEDVNAVAGFLSRTGRDSVTPTDKERLVVGGDEWRPRTPEEHAQHHRMEAIHNITESPFTVSVSKFLGLSDQQAYAAGRIANLLTDMAGAHLEAAGRRGAGGVDARAGERNQAEARPQESAGAKPGPEMKPAAWMNAPREASKDVRAEHQLHLRGEEVARGAPRGDQYAGRPEPAPGPAEGGKAPGLKPGISLNETREEASRLKHFPDASPTVVKQPGVDWVQGGIKVETAHATAKGTELRQTTDGGGWIQNKRLDPEAPPGTVDAKAKGMATTSYEERIPGNVREAVNKFQGPVTRDLSSRSATVDGVTNTTVLKNPDGLVINLEVPGLQNLPPERQGKIQEIATQALNAFREVDGNLWGKPARIQVVPTP